MRTSLLLVAAAAVIGAPAPVQAQRIEVNDLRPPTSPAFVLLGVAPSSVERPTSPTALAATLLTATGLGADLLPDDYALELTPYWLTSRPSLTFDQYYHPSLGRSVLQTLSLSLATAALPAGDTAGTALGMGARAFLLSGDPSPRVQTLRDSLEQAALQVSRLEGSLDSLEDLRQAAVERGDQRTADRLAQLKATVVSRQDTLERNLGEVANAMQAEDQERVGWIVEAVGALVIDFPQDIVDSAEVGRAGFWLTAAYRLPTPRIDLVGVVRYIRDERGPQPRGFLDLGGRLALRTKDLAISAEFVEHVGDRDAGGTPPGYRVAANLEYRLSGLTYLTATFGRDDDQSSGGGSRLISQIGINFGFGDLPVLRP